MAIPPFPSQDLAKLVLGYLAEEQLMTAYDEFLQASPYLDAMRNEYDRIFMTSLKNILAEYRAVKIYVETCKPFLLRKKLFQCVNLLEIVKFLVNNVDVNKIYAQDIGDKNSLEKHNVSFKNVQCEVCASLKLANCVCKGKQNKQNIVNDENASQMEESSLQNSIETTTLADLPGNNGTVRKRQVKRLSKKNKLLQCDLNNENDKSVKQPVSCLNNCTMQQHPKNNNTAGNINDAKSSTLCTFELNVEPTCVQGAETNIKVCNNTKIDKKNSRVCARNNSTLENKGISSTSSFQDFASGVRAGCENKCATAPDSSTSETTNFQTPVIKNDMSNHRENPKSKIVNIEPINKNMQSQGNTSIATVTTSYSKIQPKTDQHKIKILSDIKVDNAMNSNERKLIPALRNATSTPLMQMRTIVINGTPAYKPNPINIAQQNFTKDEIMAMPTIIVVPSSDPTRLSRCRQISPMTQSSNFVSLQSKPSNVLSPLVIDVSPGSSEDTTKDNESTKVAANVANEVGIIKTADIAQQKMTSVPKDCITTCTAETSTPMVMPPLRKSSSTPRRTSHIRVLDFTTPRRVLHETVIEQGDTQVELDVGKNINRVLPGQVDFTKSENDKQITNVLNVTTKSTKDYTEKVITNKKSNWDADLRAMIAKDEQVLSNTTKKTRLKTTKKKKTSTKKTAEKDEILEKNVKGRKRKKKLEEEDEPDLAITSDAVPVKPTINIKPAADRGTTSRNIKKQVIENDHMKNNEEECIDTPEVDRISLQNAIGAKLNISDLLETPYKQVFYDIQMETPRCLVPDMPDDPMSDIKIMNIPTPRFFDSPKIVQATPSSYSSRPTDYSSGGSYYKPDDQDYFPLKDVRCPVTSSKAAESNVELSKDEINDKRILRPVRQCAKNVSYYRSHKTKDGEDKTELASICSETGSANTSHDMELDKGSISKNSQSNESTKLERTKKNGRKKKSPRVKEKPKTFMKIKPRRITPTKETLSGKSRKRKLQANSPKLEKKISSKEKYINITPIVSSVRTTSRRKSSTPRKLHCSKTFNSESTGHHSPGISDDIKQQNVTRDANSFNIQDSDTEQLNLRWSDDGSQDVKVNEGQKNVSESEDILQIQEYIKTTVIKDSTKETSTVLQTHLVKRGFDEVTAKIIERDLLDTPPHNEINQTVQENILEPIDKTKNENTSERSFDTDSNITNELQIVSNNREDDDEIELSVNENNEETYNWYHLTFNDDSMEDKGQQPFPKFKDTFSMEVCIEDGIAIRLRATPFNSLFDLEVDQNETFCDKEMQAAVESISTIEKLYTPLKDSLKAQCYEIFDSTLTSLDTPLKVSSPKRNDSVITVTEVILEEEKMKNKDKTESKKRKRPQNSNGPDDSLNESKKTKPDTQYLLTSANIQNIDIESVLTKLHGP